jgi:mannose-6-phosphate isomerase-like protein (cupin superfamily)
MVSINNISNAEHYTWGAGCDGWRLLNRGDLSVIQERIPPGRGEVLHYHSRARQLFYVLEGRVEMEIAGEKMQLVPGDSLEIAPMQNHCITNVSDSDAHFLVISSPSTTGDRVNLKG